MRADCFVSNHLLTRSAPLFSGWITLSIASDKEGWKTLKVNKALLSAEGEERGGYPLDSGGAGVSNRRHPQPTTAKKTKVVRSNI